MTTVGRRSSSSRSSCVFLRLVFPSVYYSLHHYHHLLTKPIQDLSLSSSSFFVSSSTSSPSQASLWLLLQQEVFRKKTSDHLTNHLEDKEGIRGREESLSNSGKKTHLVGKRGGGGFIHINHQDNQRNITSFGQRRLFGNNTCNWFSVVSLSSLSRLSQSVSCQQPFQDKLKANKTSAEAEGKERHARQESSSGTRDDSSCFPLQDKHNLSHHLKIFGCNRIEGMDTSSIITQVTREGEDQQMTSFPASGDTFKGGGGQSSCSFGNNNNAGNSSSCNNSSMKHKARQKGLLHSIMCCFRWTNRGRGSSSRSESNGAIIHSNNSDSHHHRLHQHGSHLLMDRNSHPSLNHSSHEVVDYFAPKLQGKCLLPALKSNDPALHQMCLVIDLDETLVHSSFKPIANPDFIVPVEIDGTIHQVYVLKRPFVDEFLQKMGQLYECVLFTASLAKYADPVADLLDKWGVFRARLFRESCVFYRGNYVKDLGRLGRDLHRVVIVDNSPASYIFHPDNAVPVASWFDNMNDTELRDLIPFFEKLSRVENIYTVLRNANHVSNSPFNDNSDAGDTSGDHHRDNSQGTPVPPTPSPSPVIQAPASPGSIIHSTTRSNHQ